MLSLHVTSLYMCLWNWDKVGKTWDGGSYETCFCIRRTGGISTFGIERRTEKAKWYWRNSISQRKGKCKLGIKYYSGNNLWNSTTDFYYGFWSLANRLKSLLKIKPLPSRGKQFMFIDGDFDDNIHDHIILKKCFSKWNLTWQVLSW